MPINWKVPTSRFKELSSGRAPGQTQPEKQNLYHAFESDGNDDDDESSR